MIPPFPIFIFSMLSFILEYFEVLRARLNPPPPFPFTLLAVFEEIVNILDILTPIHVVIQRHYNGQTYSIPTQSLWNTLVASPGHFWLQTGETPGSLSRVVERLRFDLTSRVRDPWNPRRRIQHTRPYALCIHDRVLLTFMWLRQYQTEDSLAQRFRVSVSNVCDIIHTILLLLYEHYVSRYITWNSDNDWENQRNYFDEFPNAVGAIDAFAVQVSRPQGRAQRLYYRRDRGFHFLNFHVIVDNLGYVQFVQGGFLGHATDADSFRRLPSIGYQQQLHLPQGTYLLADGGYPRQQALLVPIRRPRGGRLNLIHQQANVELDAARVYVEHCIGDGRIYNSIPGRSGRFRGRRYFVCVVVYVVLALTNRRRTLIRRLRVRFT